MVHSDGGMLRYRGGFFGVGRLRPSRRAAIESIKFPKMTLKATKVFFLLKPEARSRPAMEGPHPGPDGEPTKELGFTGVPHRAALPATRLDGVQGASFAFKKAFTGF